MISRFHQRENRGCDGGHARREEQRRVGAFEFRNRVLGNRVGRVAITRVVTVCRSGANLLLHVGDFEGGSLINRSHQRAILLIEVGAAAHGFGFLPEFMLCHGESPVEMQLAASAGARLLTEYGASPSLH